MTDDYQRTEVNIAAPRVDSKPRFYWEATVRFETNYNLPDNVLEMAVVRAISYADKTVQVVKLVALTAPMTEAEWRPFADALGIDPVASGDEAVVTPPIPASQAEWEAHWAFYKLTVLQRDSAWREIQFLKERISILTRLYETRT